jgi:transcriptional regulator with XRE-family HTH domain
MKIVDDSGDEATLVEIGARLRRHRLDRDLTQGQLASEAGVSKRTVERLESGRSTQLSSFVRILRALGLLPNLEALVPGTLVRPLDQLRLGGLERRRASGRTAAEADATWSWGDEP